MKKILAGIGLSLLLTSAAYSQAYECKFGEQRHASRAEQRANARDPDPVVSIFIQAWSDEDERDHMRVWHVTRAGRMIDRANQYSINPKLIHKEQTWTWFGYYNKNTRVRMVGSLIVGDYLTTYTETRYENNRPVWSNQTICREAYELPGRPDSDEQE